MISIRLPVVATILFSSTLAFSKEQHAAHEHGKAELNVAVDGQTVTLAFESPAESIYGFEHEAKTAKDITTRDAAAKLLKDNAAALFQFQADRGCTLNKSTIEPWVKEGDDKEDHDHDHDHGSDAKKSKSTKSKTKPSTRHKHSAHGEVHADYTFTCTKAPAGSKLIVNLTDSFPRLREIAVQLISDQKQTGSTIKSSNKTLDL